MPLSNRAARFCADAWYSAAVACLQRAHECERECGEGVEGRALDQLDNALQDQVSNQLAISVLQQLDEQRLAAGEVG